MSIEPTHVPSTVGAAIAADGTFVGRRREMEAIRGSLDSARAGSGRLEVVSGSPGIGKTRLTYEVATVARGRGFSVLRGGCWEGEGAPAYWPWSELLRHHLGAVGAEQVPLGDATDFSQLLEIAATRAGVPIRGVVDVTKEAQQARFMLFDRFCEFLGRIAAAHPLLLVIDDAHWADAGSLLLLQFLAGRLAKMPLAVIVTSREPLSELTASITRHPWARHQVLPGLTRAEARTLLAAYVTRAPRRSELDRMMHLTGGNPYFVKELGQLLADGQQVFDAEEAIPWPASLLAVTLQPYHRLSLDCRTLLQAASVVGRDFDAEVTAVAARMPVRHALTLLDEAVEQRVIAHVGASRYQFLHALVREAILGRLHPSDRIRLHEATALALDHQAGAGDLVSSATLAHHFCNGLPLTKRRQAAGYCIAAGESAYAAFAFEEAVFQFRRALGILGTSSPDREACDLLLRLGAAEAGAGEWALSRRTFEDAAAIARRLACPDRLSRAALGFRGMMWATNPVDSDAIELLEEARLKLAKGSLSLQIEVLSVLSRSLYFSTDKPRARQYSDTALALASKAGDNRLSVIALEAHIVTFLQPGQSNELLRAAETLLRLSDTLSDPQYRFNANIFRQFALLSLGRLAEADAELELVSKLATSYPHPRFKWQLALLRAARATLRGHLALAEKLSATAHDLGSRIHDSSPIQYQLLQGFHRAQLRHDVVAWSAIIQQALEQLPQIPAVRIAHAWLLAHTSHHELATEALHELSANSFELVPPNFLSLWLLTVMADTAARVADQYHARLLYEHLLPHASHFIVAGWGTLVDGSVHHYIGLLAQTLGMYNTAREHFEHAIAANRRIGAPALTARSSFHLAHLLASLDSAADRPTALALAQRASGTFSSLTLTYYAQQAEALCSTIEAGHASTPHISPIPPRREDINVFRREGDFWTISYKGRTSRLRATLGFEYLSCLLSHPTTPIHVWDLVTRHTGGPGNFGIATATSDATARSAYRKRISELTSELDDADANHDLGRRELLLKEREQLLAELSGAFSSSGRPRPYRSDAERARISVRNRITSALQRLANSNPPCATFLRHSIKTGMLCVYDPSEPTTWQL